jgi:hypothetical protein
VNTAPATARDLALLVDALPAGTLRAGAGIGRFQFAAERDRHLYGRPCPHRARGLPYLSLVERIPATNEARGLLGLAAA